MTNRWFHVCAFAISAISVARAQPVLPATLSSRGQPEMHEELDARTPTRAGRIVGDETGDVPKSRASKSRAPKTRAPKTRAEAELRALQKEELQTKRRAKRRVRALYRLSRLRMLSASGGVHTTLGHLARLNRLERVVVSDVRMLHALRKRISAQQVEVRRLARDSGSAGEGETQVSAYVGGQPFSSQRGDLRLPLSGPRSVRAAQQHGDPGLALVPDISRPVVSAVAHGRVAFVGSQAPFGRLVIVDHGESFFTVYAGLSEIDTAVGEFVSRGAALGAAREEMFFQVRRGTRGLDAASWLDL